LPKGKRRASREDALAAKFDEDFAGRVLPFDTGAVAASVGIVGDRCSPGRPVAEFDAQIAAMARHAGAKLAIRMAIGFETCGVALI
jgi:predicted nucleic acid-binding protein